MSHPEFSPCVFIKEETETWIKTDASVHYDTAFTFSDLSRRKYAETLFFVFSAFLSPSLLLVVSFLEDRSHCLGPAWAIYK